MLKALGPLYCYPVMYLVHVWYDDRYWSKILWVTILAPVHDLKVKVTDSEIFIFLIFYIVTFCKAFDGFDECLA